MDSLQYVIRSLIISGSFNPFHFAEIHTALFCFTCLSYVYEKISFFKVQKFQNGDLKGRRERGVK